MIHQFFISDENEMRRCQMACAKRVSVLIGGIDANDNNFRVYRGLVKSVEDFTGADELPTPRWRMTVQAWQTGSHAAKTRHFALAVAGHICSWTFAGIEMRI